MLKKLNLVGLIIGVAIIVCSFLVFNFDAETESPDMNAVSLDSISAPQYELDKSYGGDAYTGIQQAAAQAANNLIPVFNAVRENTDAVIKANGNNILQAEAYAQNLTGAVTIVKCGFGFLLLTIGLVVISKNVEIELPVGKKEEQSSAEF